MPLVADASSDIFSAPAEPSIDTAKLEKDFRSYPTKILSVLIERGDLPKLHKAAGVKSANAFGDMPIDDQAAAYVKFVEQGGKPVDGLPADYNAWVASQEREIEVRRLQSDRVVRQANGKPFKTEAGAKQMQERFDLQGTHEIVAVDGGFELRQLSPSAQAEIRRKAEGRESYTEAQSAVAAEMGIGQTADGEWDATDEQFDEMERRTQARMRGDSAPQPAQPQTAPRRRQTARATDQRIDDFGEKIGGARKDVWSGFKDGLNAVKNADIASEPFSKIWPVPDYQKLIDDGMSAEAVATIRAMRDEIPVKPRASWKVKRWAQQVQALRDFANDVLNGTYTLQQIKDMAGSKAVLGKVFGRIDLYQAVGHGQSLQGVNLAFHHYTIYKGKENVSLWVVEQDVKATAWSNWPRELATGETKEAAIAAFKKKLATLDINTPDKKETSFEIYSRRGEKGYWIGKKVGRNPIFLEGPFDSVKEARAYKDANNAKLVDKLEQAKQIPNERRETNEPRVGVDMRNGQDVTPQMFGDTFGFRGVEFGNWVEQGKRQQDLNEAFDALMDMAAILNVPPRALSLNGELGIAFGARGKGGKNSAKAHYEPGFVAINLTKKEGAGSLGHEWWHALDWI